VKVLRAGVCLLVAFSVLAHGVVEVWSESVLEIAAALLFLSWAFVIVRTKESKVEWNGLLWAVAGLLAWPLVQLALRITVYPFLTWTGILRWGAIALIFFVSTQVFRERQDYRMLTWFFVVLGFAVGLEGIIQYYTSTESIYWVRRLSAGRPFGPYVNRNHFAGLMELLVPVGVSFLAFRGARRDMVPLVGLLTLVPIGAIFLSASRGGIVAFLFEMGILATLFVFRRSRSVKIVPLAAFLLLGIAVAGWLGATRAVGRFLPNQPGEATVARRLTMFRAATHIFLAHPLTGTGLGTLINVFPRFELDYDGKVVDHAHNDYIETLADLGLPGGLLGLAFLWVLFKKGTEALGSDQNQSHFSFAFHAAALTACTGLLIHGLVDFNFQIPSNALIFLIQAGLGVSPPLVQEVVVRKNRRSSMQHSTVDTGVLARP
jgi:O-antigen ligase